MLRPRLLARIAVVCGLAWLGACDDSDLRDQYYGTDAGANYQAPEGGVNPPVAKDTGSTADGARDAGALDASADAAADPADASADAATPG